MSIPAKQSGQLQALFSILSETHRQTLAMTIKAAKADGETKLPCDELLVLLGDNKPQESRWDTLFDVVQPLLVDTASRCDQIEFAFLNEVWEFYLRELGPAQASAWLCGQASAVDVRESIISKFQELLETSEGKYSLETRFGADRMHQLEILLSLLRHSEEVSDFFSEWPQSIKNLNDTHLAPLREFHDHLIIDSPDITPHLLFLTTCHLLHPFQIFRAVEKITGRSDDRVMVKTQLKVIGDAILDQNEIWLEAFKWEKMQTCDPDKMLVALQSFIDLTTGWLSEFDIDPSGPWGKRLAKQRARCGKLWDEYMRRIQKTVEHIMPRKRGTVTGRQTMPDFFKEFSEEKIAQAESEIALFLAILPFASQGGFQLAKEKLLQLLESRLAEQSDDLLALFGQNEISNIEQVNVHFDVLVRMTQVYLGSENADILARRGATAIAA